MHNLFFTVLCLVQISLSTVQSKYLAYFEEPKNWLTANETCTKCGGKLVNWDKNVSEIVSHNNIQNKVIWIGNYTRQYPWIQIIGCINKQSLEDTDYNTIHQNTPEFCSRTCSDDQYFALEGEKCYCIGNENVGDISCTSSYEDFDNSFMDDYVTVLKIDKVYTCDFKNTSCKNTSFDNQERGLVWKRTKHYEIDSTDIENEYFLLLQGITETVGNKAQFSIRLNLESMYYCLSFRYCMNYSGSIEVYVLKETGESYVAWKKYGNKGNMWYSSAVDIKGYNNIKIDIYGSIENFNIGSVINKIAIDDIKLKPLTCNEGVLFYCPFLTNICDLTVEDGLLVFLKKFKGMNSLNIDNYGTEKYKNYTIRTPLIKVPSSRMYCLTFFYFIYRHQEGALKIFKETEGNKSFQWRNNGNSLLWKKISLSIEANNDFVILFEVERKFQSTTTLRDIKIANLMVKSGICKEDKTYQDMMKPMFPVIDFADNSRLSVGNCSSMEKQSYICEFENETKSDCPSFLSLNESTAETDDIEISSFMPITSTYQPSANISEKVFAEHKEPNIEFVGIGILLAVVVVLAVLAAWLCYKLKRNEASVKDKEPLSYVGSIQNRGYEMAAVDTSHIQPPPADGTGYELASPDQQQRYKEKNIYSNDNSQKKSGNDYQNYENYTGDHRHDSQVYQETGQGDYDHLGESATRRKNLSSESDTLYDHGQTINSRNNGLYDTTKPETVDDYFLLEPENGASRESEIYDHTK